MLRQQIYPLILAGGSGTRLWPASRAARPKHLLPLVDEHSLLQETSRRLCGVAPAANQFVVTSAAYGDQIRAQLPEVPGDQIVEEPLGLGTAAAVGLGAALVKARDPEGILVCCPADHVITPLDGFRKTVMDAAAVAAGGSVVVIGIEPASAATGFGYIQPGEELGGGAGGARRVAAFHEKPDPQAALSYVAAGYLWNAGVFIWSVETIWREYGAHLPSLAQQMDQMVAAASSGQLDRELPRLWALVTDRTTVDYGVLERSDRVACLRAAFAWSDVGSWDALAAVLAADDDGNHVEGEAVVRDSSGTLVMSMAGRMVAVSGVRDMIVVDTGDALLVMPRDRAQEVRGIVESLRSSGRSDLL